LKGTIQHGQSDDNDNKSISLLWRCLLGGLVAGVSGRYTYRAGGRASSCVAALTRECSVVLQCLPVACRL